MGVILPLTLMEDYFLMEKLALSLGDHHSKDERDVKQHSRNMPSPVARTIVRCNYKYSIS